MNDDEPTMLEINGVRWTGWRATAIVIAFASPAVFTIFSVGFAVGRWSVGH